jgi:hypothetical protein
VPGEQHDHEEHRGDRQRSPSQCGRKRPQPTAAPRRSGPVEFGDYLAAYVGGNRGDRQTPSQERLERSLGSEPLRAIRASRQMLRDCLSFLGTQFAVGIGAEKVLDIFLAIHFTQTDKLM